MTRMAIIDEREITITPVFRIDRIENIPKSEKAGHAVLENREVVEVRFAGSKHYSPVFPAHAMWQRDPEDGNRIITYAERWSEQYRAFKEGNPQEAAGTPLEMLRSHGITPEMLSLCRALRIYSIEALHHLEGPAVKTLGMNANKLKAAAARYMADRTTGAAAMDEIATLKAELAALREQMSTTVPVKDMEPAAIDAAVKAADAAYTDLSDEQIKARIKELTQAAPRGNPSRDTLVRLLTEIEAG